eukprot:4900929-Pyramimonas_sp.AAC.1
MAERAVDVEAPADSSFLALKVLVTGWPWAPPLARSALQARMETSASAKGREKELVSRMAAEVKLTLESAGLA